MLGLVHLPSMPTKSEPPRKDGWSYLTPGDVHRAALIRSAVFGPIPGTSVSRPSRAAWRSSSAVRIPSTRPISAARLALRPNSRPRPTSCGETVRSSSTSSAISPVRTSSRSFPSMPRPIPRSSRARPERTSAATGAGVALTRAAARRYARTPYGFAPARSRRAANASSRSASSGFSRSRGGLTRPVSAGPSHPSE